MNQKDEMSKSVGEEIPTEVVEEIAEHVQAPPIGDKDEEETATKEHVNNLVMDSTEDVPLSNEEVEENEINNNKIDVSNDDDKANVDENVERLVNEEEVGVSKKEYTSDNEKIRPEEDAEETMVEKKQSQEDTCNNRDDVGGDIADVKPQQDCAETIANEKDTLMTEAEISGSEKDVEEGQISKTNGTACNEEIATREVNEKMKADDKDDTIKVEEEIPKGEDNLGDVKIIPKEDDAGPRKEIEVHEKRRKILLEESSQSKEDDAKIRPAHDNEVAKTDSNKEAKRDGGDEIRSHEQISGREGAADYAKIKPDGDDDDDDKEDSDEEEDQQPTDEYGRPLSAYEIMRLERIKRNKAYLAQLGLEQNGGKKNGTLLSEHEENMRKQKALKKKEKKEKEITVMRRSMSRRTKGKNINYSEPTVAEFKLPPSERKKEKEKNNENEEEKEMDEKTKAAMLDKKARKEKRENRVPLFIYQELKQVEKKRKQAVRTAEKLVRASEKEMRIIKRQVDAVERKEKQRKEREELKAFAPVINEIDRGRVQLIKTLRKIDHDSKEKRMTAEEWKNARERNIALAEEKFPTLMKEAKQTLGQALMDRLPPFEKIEQNSKSKIKGSGRTETTKKKSKAKISTSAPKKKVKASNVKKGGSAAGNKNCDSVGEGSNATGANLIAPKVSIPGNLDFEKLREAADRSKRRDSNKITKTRNVGGPVTTSLGATVQRKWLESDGPVAPTLNEYAPQAGDTVLYYPCAHYDFLRKHPDIRCKKSRLALRRPLWQRAVDEMKAQEEKKDTKIDSEQAETPKKSKGEKTKPWWSVDWISTVQCGAGRQPIVCRVEKVIAEFPFDEESASEIRKFHYQQKKGQSGSEKKEKKKQEKNRQKPSRRKPLLGISVTLKALTPVVPPSQSEKAEELLAPPPLFSVLTFPSDTAAQFLLPFASAYRSLYSVIGNDCFKIIGKDGSRRNATIVEDGESLSDTLDNVCHEFGSILKKYADVDFTSIHKLDNLITEGYSMSKENIVLPEGAFRSAIQTILYHYHTRDRKVGQTVIPSVETNSSIEKQSETVLISKITNLILSNLPFWNSVKIIEEGSNLVKSTHPWKISSIGDNNQSSHERTVTTALAPSILISQQRSCSGGLIYSIDETLRGQIEMLLKYIIENDPKSTIFVPPVTDAIAPEYSRFVPVSMCLKRILKRLKLQNMRFQRHYNRNAEDVLEDQNFDGHKCCYYRSLSSLHSDIADIFQNCLLYNAPESGIVQDAYDVTTFLSVAIDKLADDRLRDQQEARRKAILQMKNVESVARGELGLFKASKRISIPAHEVEDYNMSFNHPLNRAWMKATSSSSDRKKQYSADFLPQCGDKVIYNRILHGKFINTHFDSLPSRHRGLPSILPFSRKKREKIAKASTNETSQTTEMSESDLYQYWLGTIMWTRCIFPNPDEETNGGSSTPFLAIGVQFHYKWLAKSVHVLCWKPVINDREGQIQVVKDSVFNDQSFLSPAWMGPVEKILPPFPLSKARVEEPTGLLPKTVDVISKCLSALKMRIVDKHPVDAFEPNGKDGCSFFVHDIPVRFHHIFDDEEGNDSIAGNDSSSLASQKELSQVVYIPPWSLPSNQKGKETRGRVSISSRHERDERSFHETIMANPYLCLDLVFQRLKGGYYRNLMAVIEDIREAFVSNTIYVLKERIRSRRLGKASEGTVLRAIMNSFHIEIKNDSLDISEGSDPAQETTSQISGTPINLSDLNHQERSTLVHLQAIHKVYSTALCICMEFTTAELIFGLEPQNYIQLEQKPEDAQKEDVTRITNQILSALGPDKTKFRKPLASCGSKPSVKVILKLDTNQNESQLSSSVGVGPHGKNHLAIDASDLPETFFNSSSNFSATIKIKVRCNGVSDQEWEDMSLPNPPMYHNQTSLIATSSKEEDAVDLTQSVIFSPADYENDPLLIRALFCRSKRKHPCARCVLKKNDIFTCRVGLAHSNLDFIWCDYIKNIGGVRGILEALDPTALGSTPVSIPSQINVTDSITNDSHEDSNKANDIGDTGKAGDKIGTSVNNAQAPPLQELHAKASRAESLTRAILTAANKALETPIHLSDDFMNDNFSIDPDDGHFEICQLCGLGGEVICCETCPAVSHPKCVGAEINPNEEWRCFKCLEKDRNKSNPQQDVFDILKDDDGYDPDQSTEDKVEYSISAVTSLIEELKSYRQKPAKIDIGTKILKDFHGTSFIGEVISLPDDENDFYGVIYDDGDKEDLTLEEIQPCIDAFNNKPEPKVEPVVEAKRLGRPRKNPEVTEIAEESTLKRKLGVGSKAIASERVSKRGRGRRRKVVEEISPQPTRGRGRGRRKRNDAEESPSPELMPKRGRGRPRKLASNSTPPIPEPPKRGRGRPRKRALVTNPSPSPDPPIRGRGRGRKRTIQVPQSNPAPAKRGRGRPKKKSQEPNVQSGQDGGPHEDLELLDLEPDQAPAPGCVDKKVTYYCTKENDTSVSIARAIGCNSWRDIAYIPENLARFPALRNKKTKFRGGTFVRIGEANFVLKKAMQLVQDT